MKNLDNSEYTPSESEFMSDYTKMILEEEEKERIQNEDVLSKIKPLVSENYFDAINLFLYDDEHGIWGNLMLVDKPIGEWQDELNEWNDDTYWLVLKGMYVNQSCGYTGDDYNGTLEIKITDDLFLRCSFSL